MSLLLLLIFLAVSLTILVSGFLWSDLAQRDEQRAVRRLGEELSRPLEENTKRLFQDVSDFDLGEQQPFPAAPGGLPSLSPDGELLPGESGGPRSAPSPPTSRAARLKDHLKQAGVRLTPRLFLALCGSTALAMAALGMLVHGWLLAVPGLFFGGSAPWLCLSRRVQARRDKLLRQLSPAFELMARVLRAGLSMPQAFQSVAEAFEEPIASEFARCHQEQNLGIFPEVSFRNLAERTGVLEMKIFVMAMVIQRQTGGNMAEVLERLSGLIRDRLRLRNQIRTLTAEGRLQAVVLLVLPLAMFLVMRLLNRPYSDVLLDHPGLLAGTGALMAAGALWIRKVITIE